MKSDKKIDRNKLSWREKQILTLVVQGFTSKEIGSQLRLSFRTVEGHRAKLLKKTKAKNSVELLKYVSKNKLRLKAVKTPKMNYQNKIALTRSQKKVLSFIVKGFSSEKIARKLKKSVRTIDGFRERISRKIKAKNRIQLIKFGTKY